MKKGRIGITILLLFILFASATGNYSRTGIKYYMDYALLFGFIDSVIATVVMMFCPLICRIVNKGRLSYKKGKKVCLWNSIILLVVSIVLNITFQFSIIGGIGALAFYFINKWSFVEENNSEKKAVDFLDDCDMVDSNAFDDEISEKDDVQNSDEGFSK